MIGLGLVALLISYLPSIYTAFARREQLVGMLESRAGSPPSAVVMLTRYINIGAMANLDDELFKRWETWFIDVEESHTSFPALVFFRSSARAILDRRRGLCARHAAIVMSTVDRPAAPPPS